MRDWTFALLVVIAIKLISVRWLHAPSYKALAYSEAWAHHYLRSKGVKIYEL